MSNTSKIMKYLIKKDNGRYKAYKEKKITYEQYMEVALFTDKLFEYLYNLPIEKECCLECKKSKI